MGQKDREKPNEFYDLIFIFPKMKTSNLRRSPKGHFCSPKVGHPLRNEPLEPHRTPLKTQTYVNTWLRPVFLSWRAPTKGIRDRFPGHGWIVPDRAERSRAKGETGFDFPNGNHHQIQGPKPLNLPDRESKLIIEYECITWLFRWVKAWNAGSSLSTG